MLAAWAVDGQTVFSGAVVGMSYGLMAIGLVLIYRSSRVVNFAQGEIGALGAVVFAKMVLDWGWGYLTALAVVVLGGVLVGAAIELTVVRRLFRAPRVVLFVATVGLAELLLLVQLLVPDVEVFHRFPAVTTESWTVGGIVVRGDQLAVIVAVPIVVVGLWWFLNRTRTGLAIRASADNPDSARLSAVSVKRMSTIVWATAGGLAVITLVIVAPVRGITTAATNAPIGPGVLLRALAAALIARLLSIPIAMIAGIAIGIVEAVLFFNVLTPGFVELVLFVLILAAVVLRRSKGAFDEETGAWAFSPRLRAIPPRLADIWWVRRMGRIGSLAALLVALAMPFVVTSASQQFLFSRVMLFAVVALSVTIVTGWSGQLSLGQMAFAGLGAFATAALCREEVPFVVAVVAATAVCVGVAIVIGLPSLRVRGLMLAVTTLGFAIAAQRYLFQQPWLLGDGTSAIIPRAELGPIDLAPQRTYYFLSLAVLVLAVLVVLRLRRGGITRLLVGVRDNERNAVAFTISPTRAKLAAFGLAGGLAGLAGALLGGLLVQFGPQTFDPIDSIRVVAMTIIGGLGTIAGPILGALWVVGLPSIFDDSTEVALLTSGAGLLILLMYFPGGLVQILYAARDAALDAVARRLPDQPAKSPDARLPAPPKRAGRRPIPDGVALRVTELSVRFGGHRAVDDVSFEIDEGEIVGLIGTNGAGKTTLMNAICGFVPSTGTIELLGANVTHASSVHRARAGLGRAFQDAALFADLTVRESLLVSLEAHSRTSLPATILGLPRARRAERTKGSLADEYIDFLGLGRYADTTNAALSTGSRRITELACLLAMNAPLLFLDEPTAGIAQRESEAFGPLIRDIHKEFGTTLVVIEHDIPLIMSIANRVYCLEAGRIIAHGTPAAVRADPLVIASYLGTDERALQRSDAPA